MNNRTRIPSALSIVAVLLLAWPSTTVAQAATPQDTLNQYVSDLQRNPSDTALREKIIRLAQEINPPPAIPEDAERFMVRGQAAFKMAKSPDDFNDAVMEFGKATLAAPWLADAYNNLGVAQEKAGLYGPAMESFKLYLLAAPDAPDAKEKRTLIYELEYRRDKAAKDKEMAVEEAARARELAAQKAAEDQRAQLAQAAESNKPRTFADLLRKIDGRRYLLRNVDHNTQRTRWCIVYGKTLKFFDDEGTWGADIEMKDRDTLISYPPSRLSYVTVELHYIISEDGDSITAHLYQGDGSEREYVWLWQR